MTATPTKILESPRIVHCPMCHEDLTPTDYHSRGRYLGEKCKVCMAKAGADRLARQVKERREELALRDARKAEKARLRNARKQEAKARKAREREAARKRARKEQAVRTAAKKTARKTSAVERELAARVLASRHLLPFILRNNKNYMPGWVHKDICHRLEKFTQDIVDKKSPRLMLQMPPRGGKSEIASINYPAWFLGNHPDLEVIACSYAADLANDFSRKVRALLKGDKYKATFPETRLDPDSSGVEGWNTTKGGGYKPAGVSGPVTGKGAHCFPAGTPVRTPEGPVPIEALQPHMQVITLDLATGETHPATVQAVHSHHATDRLIEITTAAGKRVRATQDHRFFVPAVGWVEARHLRAGDAVTVLEDSGSLHDMRNAVSELPHGAPQVFADTVSSVEVVGEEGVRVYDIQVEGTHCFFAGEILAHNCLIIDDPVKNAAEAESEATRQATRDWYQSTAYTRLAPGGGVLVIQTRWHFGDLSGWLEERMEEERKAGSKNFDEWEIIRYPAIATEDEPYRRKGEALHPERYDVDQLLKIKEAVGPRYWSAMYQQQPVNDDGDYFTRGMMNWYATNPPESLTTYTAWDLAIGKGDRNDYTVGIVIGVDKDENIYVLDMRRGRWDAFEIVEQMIDVQKRFHPREFGVEKGQIQMAIGPYLEKRKAEERVYEMNVRELPPGRRDKESRARAIQGRMRQGRVFLPRHRDWVDELVGELLRFPNGVHDDCVDALAWIGLMLNELSAPYQGTHAKRKQWKDTLGRLSRQSRRKNFMSA